MNILSLKQTHLTSVIKTLGCALAISIVANANASKQDEIKATVDGIQVMFPDAKPMMVNNRVMVPVRGVFEHMNATVDWEQATRTVRAKHGTDHIVLTINSNVATVNDHQVPLDSPPFVTNGSTMVPLRFLGEAMGATVQWMANTSTVEIATGSARIPAPQAAGYSLVKLSSGTVIPFRLNKELSSNGSTVGEKFRATVDSDSANYQGMNPGTILEGHVNVAQPRSGDTPGVLGLAFDRVIMTDGKAYNVHGALIGLDSNSVVDENGRLVAKAGSKDDNLKYVGYGAGAGALISIIGHKNLITSTLIGSALGLIFGEVQKSQNKARDVTLTQDSRFGMRLTQDVSYRAQAMSL